MIRDLKGVVITGMGVITPIGNSLDEFWNNLVFGKSGVDTSTKFDFICFVFRTRLMSIKDDMIFGMLQFNNVRQGT